jgi:2-polyprenyl-6-methoxyphenol hydroxylase-like FAD-dependent oxidoreductase
MPWTPDTRFPGWRSLPQDSIEEVLQDALDGLGQRVEWHTRLVDLSVSEAGVEAQLQTPTGTRRVQARWLLACDGAHGVTRGLVGIALPMPQPGSFRLILHVPADTGEPRDSAWYEALLQRRTGVNYGLRDVSWVSLFALRSGVAERLRSGPDLGSPSPSIERWGRFGRVRGCRTFSYPTEHCCTVTCIRRGAPSSHSSQRPIPKTTEYHYLRRPGKRWASL